jgi:hypothetical protein
MIINQLKKYRIQIAALSETCMYASGVKLVSDYTMIYSGLPYDKKMVKLIVKHLLGLNLE